MSAHAAKYDYIKVIQGNFGHWEDCAFYDKEDFSCIKEDLKNYRLSSNHPYRVINLRVLKGEV